MIHRQTFPASPLASDRQPRPVASVLAGLCTFLGAGLLPTLIAGCGGSAGTAPTTAPAAIAVTVSGPASTRLGATTQFTATVTNATSSAVTWQVNGVAGGAAATGTISATGLYTAPASLPNPSSVSISAVSQQSSTASGSLAEALWNPVPVVSAVSAIQVSGGTVAIDVTGSGFVSGAQIQAGGVSLATTAVSATELQASAPMPAGATALSVDVLNPDPGSASSPAANVTIQSPRASVTAASRLLDQATFGPTLNDIRHVQSVGFDGWLTEQFTATPSYLADVPNPQPANCLNNPKLCAESEWWQAAMTGNDQLRQRVAFALAEMFVISSNSVNAYAITPYQNVLVKDAFANFSTVMKDVTLSAGMGAYLDMLNSNKPATGQIANENYARELMQLFTTGLFLLNADGTPQLDAGGNMIPVYTEAQVQAFARAYTGWTYANSTGGSATSFPNNTANFDMPLASVATAHDTTAKTLLNGTTLPAGQTAQQDLTDALANLFQHPNVGPFVGRQLIQHLVSSNPSPAYVARVAAVFADNGNGVRGDLRAVVKAILLDPEARAGDTNAAAEGGHLREPILYLLDVMRALGYTNTDANGFYEYLSNYSSALGQAPYRSGSVFNFFPPDYVEPETGVNAPEFGLENTASAILRLSLADNLVWNRISGFRVDLSGTSTLGTMAAKPGDLVDALGVLFLHGQMPAEMRTAIVNHITTLTDPAQRVRVATYLVITSSQYKVLH